MGFNGAWLQMGEQQLHLLEVANHEAPLGQHFAFHVEDIHAVRSYVTDKGLHHPRPTELGSGCLLCVFKDPYGT